MKPWRFVVGFFLISNISIVHVKKEEHFLRKAAIDISRTVFDLSIDVITSISVIETNETNIPLNVKHCGFL